MHDAQHQPGQAGGVVGQEDHGADAADQQEDEQEGGRGLPQGMPQVGHAK